MVIKPNLFIIGVRKGGTTALYDMLEQHPDVVMSKIKEPGFFNDPKDLDEYLKLFPPKPAKYYGEASTSYSRNPETAQRIKEFNPEAKIILMLREPVSQLISSQSQRAYEQPKSQSGVSLDEQGSRHRRYLVSLREAIEEFHSQFGKKFLVVLYEDFRKNNLAVYKRVLDFLELKDFAPQLHELNVNKALKPWFLPFKKVIDDLKISIVAAKLLGPKRFQQSSSVYQNFIAKKNNSVVDENTKKALQGYFTPIVEDMDKLLQEKGLLDNSLLQEWRY